MSPGPMVAGLAKIASGKNLVAQTSVRDVCDMLIPLEAEVESLHPSAAHFYGLNHLHYLTTSIPQSAIAPASTPLLL